jgi:hypothetical protein
MKSHSEAQCHLSLAAIQASARDLMGSTNWDGEGLLADAVAIKEGIPAEFAKAAISAMAKPAPQSEAAQ